ncbi:MAG: hypothetical protein Q8O93_04960 [bacterium]|nr:hypothetical protein [bacterium]
MIDFLNNQRDQDEKPKAADGNNRPKLNWSKPEKVSDKKSPFSFLPFKDGRARSDKTPPPAVDKNKLKRSRQEILDLIKRHESANSRPKEKKAGLIASWGENLNKRRKHNHVLIDYQQAFNQEKEQKSQIGEIFNLKPNQQRVALSSRLSGLITYIKAKLAGPGEPVKANPEPPAKAPEAQVKNTAAVEPPPEVKQAAKDEPAPLPAPIEPAGETGRVLQTNLIKGEIITFFDWQRKITVLIIALLAPMAAIGIIYYGLSFYQKEVQAKNQEQRQKFNELAQNIKEEEAGLKEVSAFQDKLAIISQVFSQHVYWTNFFKFLEDNTIQDVYYTAFAGDTGGDYNLEAITSGYGGIGEQLNGFKGNKFVTGAEADGGEIIEGNANNIKVKFNLKFSVLKSIFIE